MSRWALSALVVIVALGTGCAVNPPPDGGGTVNPCDVAAIVAQAACAGGASDRCTKAADAYDVLGCQPAFVRPTPPPPVTPPPVEPPPVTPPPVTPPPVTPPPVTPPPPAGCMIEDDLVAGPACAPQLQHFVARATAELGDRTGIDPRQNLATLAAKLREYGLCAIDGIEAIRRIRALEAPYGSIAVVGVSGRGDDETAAREAGADAFLVKPVAPRALATALLAATRRAAAAP